ncbi:hypothetical protein BDV12DRAFT_206646 [Aspergillus spectabilis]
MDLRLIREQRWKSSISYDVGSIITYNLAVGANGQDLRRCWEDHPEFYALPTFTSLAVIDIMGKVSRDMPDILPLFEPQKHPHVHAEHYLELKQARIMDVVDRRTGVAVIVGITTRESNTNAEVCYNEWTSFLIRMPGDGASRPSPSNTGANAFYPSRICDASVDHQTTSEQGALYRAATGEWNPMHIDPGHGRRAGFPGPILSGTCTIGIGVRHVIDTFAGGDPTQIKSVKLRLSKPVFLGEVVTTQMWRDIYGRTIVYQQVTADGRIVISQAEISLHRNSSAGDEVDFSHL